MSIQSVSTLSLDEIYFQNLCRERLRGLTFDWFKNNKKLLDEETLKDKLSSGTKKIKNLLTEAFNATYKDKVDNIHNFINKKNKNIDVNHIGLTQFCLMPESEQIINDLNDIYINKKSLIEKNPNSHHCFLSTKELFNVLKTNKVESMVMLDESHIHMGVQNWCRLDLERFVEIYAQKVSKFDEIDDLISAYWKENASTFNKIDFNENAFRNSTCAVFDKIFTSMVEDNDYLEENLEACFTRFMEAYQKMPFMETRQLLLFSIPNVKQQEDRKSENRLTQLIECLNESILKYSILKVEQRKLSSDTSKQTKARKLKP